MHTYEYLNSTNLINQPSYHINNLTHNMLANSKYNTSIHKLMNTQYNTKASPMEL